MQTRRGINLFFRFAIYFFALIGFILTAGYFAVKWELTNSNSRIDEQDSFFQDNAVVKSDQSYAVVNSAKNESPEWSRGDEWLVFKTAVIKDRETLKKVESATGIESRLVVSLLAVEQLRLYHTNRELFKKVFYPLKLLGNQSQFSWGVMGLKQDTAVQIENHLKDSESPFYIGEGYENLFDFKSDNSGKERFERIIDEHDRYYSYLYAAVHLKQIITQWKNAGYDISDRPEIISTLFNIGFQNSKPNTNPKVGGAEIKIKNKVYSFGSLAGEFYYSNELLEEFPRDRLEI